MVIEKIFNNYDISSKFENWSNWSNLINEYNNNSFILSIASVLIKKTEMMIYDQLLLNKFLILTTAQFNK